MGEQEKKSARDLVGIRRKGRTLCLKCAGFKRSRAGDKMDRILRGEVEGGKFTDCDSCGKTLI